MRIRWLGQVPYREAWELQRALATRADADYLLLLEHPPVYTLGRNGDPAHVLTDPASIGADLVHVDRGGDVTFHGPGQLVGYPIVSVGEGPHRGTAHVRRIERVVMDALGTLGFPAPGAGRLPGYPGVWLGLDEPEHESGSPPGRGGGPRKVCAIGVRTARGRSTHGFALNVDPDLGYFDHIVPCGIGDRPVTSLRAEGWTGSVAEAVDAVVAAARRQWDGDAEVEAVTARDVVGDHDRRPAVVVRVDLGDRRAGDRPGAEPVATRALGRRLTRAGVAPGEGLAMSERKPSWLRVPVRMGDDFLGLRHELRAHRLVTVCEEAGCPNIYECWSSGTATFMINGDRCTRSCGFCQVSTARPLALDPEEPERVAAAVEDMGLAHAVVTCVARDDLDDGGAAAFAATIAAIRTRSPTTTVEVLISDCRGDARSLDTIFDARPDVLNHNIETVARLQYAVRPSAGYARSLAVLARAKGQGLTTKSGIIVGMGETDDEVRATMADLRAVGVDLLTVGQYLRPSSSHVPVSRYWGPEEFEALRVAGLALGFDHVQASPLTRSSYHAREAAESAHASAAAAGGAPTPPGRGRRAPVPAP
jgi:lipoic acid synthetase